MKRLVLALAAAVAMPGALAAAGTGGDALERRRDDDFSVLAPGFAGALVVLAQDVLQVPPARVHETKLLLTVLDDRDTYRATRL